LESCQAKDNDTPAQGTAFASGCIACISTSRADAGIYRPLLRALCGRGHWQVSCLAGGTHLSERFGHTIDEFKASEGFDLVAVSHFVDGDRPVDAAAACGRATIEFAKTLETVRPKLVFVLGDRPEMLAAALAAVICRIPIAHLHGGERTAGAYDDCCRHAITKLAHVHFAALPQYAARIAAMGEEAWRIHTVGALALDDLARFQPESVEDLRASLGLDFSQPTWVVAFHPETLSALTSEAQAAVIRAVLEKTDVNLLVVGTNADVGHTAVADAFRSLTAQKPNLRWIASMPQQRFWSCLAHARLLIGNSSAGIIEAASLKLPVVNVGDRQAGRIRPANVIDAPCDSEEMTEAIRVATSAAFRRSLINLTNPYGDGRAAARIVAAVQTLPDRQTLLRT